MKKLSSLTMLTVFVLALGAVAIAGEGNDEHKCAKGHTQTAFDSPQAVGTLATCPVLGGAFKIDEKTLHSEYKGKHVYFCCAMCKPKFDKDPEKYLKEK